MPTWFTWLIVAAGLYGLLAWAASRAVYYPTRYPGGDWDRKQLIRAEDVEIKAEDGVTLHGWFARSSSGPWATLHLHGNAGNITHRTTVAGQILEAGSSVLLLDYRGYGRSDGRPTEAGLYRDATAAYEWLTARGFRPEHIILHGESLGSAIAVELALRKQCAGLVLEAPFTSIRAMAGKALPVVGPLLISGFDTRSRIARISVPQLVVHGDGDEVIPYQFGVQVAEAAPEPKSLWTVKGAGHNDLHITAAREWVERLRVFYASLR